jgi:cysteine-rich repeat protein
VEADEECDDGNDIKDDACTNDCTLPACGDGITQDGEGCDDGNATDNDKCTNACTLPACGDGITQAGEGCDDGNQVNTDECTNACALPTCGDGFIQAGEVCDDANDVMTDACINCVAASCGDGFTQTGVEQCDDANDVTTDACISCVAATCGDGFTQAGVEECDDANLLETDGCLSSCTITRSCKQILAANPSVASGAYTIDPDGPAGANAPQLVQCDMTTDGGGWTLVGASRNGTLNDQASAYYADLAAANPTVANAGVWDGMRPLIAANSDIRFSCAQNPASLTLNVDLSFYNIGWYREITTGTEAQSCFSENDGFGDDQPTPARRNNLTAVVLPLNDQWNASGYLEGEDSCAATDDFTVDFDDRGMDSNQADGTDWGEDDGAFKCGVSGLVVGKWFIWVREP